MKTLTEFSGFTLQDIGKTRTQLLTENKTPEEISAALTEQFKVEGEKLQLLLSALDSIDNKVTDLKRIVVGTLAEGEKLPPKAVQKEDKVFLAEYFPPMNRPGGKGRFKGKGGPRDGKRGGGRNDRKGGRGGGGPGGRGDSRNNRNPDERNAGGAPSGAPAEKNDGGRDNPRFRRRPPRGPRTPPPPLTGDAAKIKIKPPLSQQVGATTPPTESSVAPSTSSTGSDSGSSSN